MMRDPGNSASPFKGCRTPLGCGNSLGVWMDYPHINDKFEINLQSFKNDIFGVRPPQKPVVFVRNHIVRRVGSFGRLNDEATRDRFDEGLLKLIRETPFLMMLVVIDKKTHEERYRYPDDPYHYCWKILLERYCGWLNRNKLKGDIVVESRNKVLNQTLLEEHQKMLERPITTYYSTTFKEVLTTKEIKFRKKEHNVGGLQLADLLVHDLKDLYMIEKKRLDSQTIQGKFAKRLAPIVYEKYNTDLRTRTREPYGQKFLD